MIAIKSVNALVPLALAGERSRHWYDEARHVLKGLYPADINLVCDVAAITSPRVAVSRNLQLTREYLDIREGIEDVDRRVEAFCTGHGVLRSVGAGLVHYEKTREIRGPKTSAFAACLKGDPHGVVLDVHMARVLVCHPNHAEALQGDLAHSRKTYRRVADRVVATACALGWPVAETQAALWATSLAQQGRKVQSYR